MKSCKIAKSETSSVSAVREGRLQRLVSIPKRKMLATFTRFRVECEKRCGKVVARGFGVIQVSIQKYVCVPLFVSTKEIDCRVGIC